jgi:hypothetical protein
MRPTRALLAWRLACVAGIVSLLFLGSKVVVTAGGGVP